MKLLLLLFGFLITNNAAAQTSFLQNAQARLETALVANDTVVLKQLLHPDLSYGHSNGWVESKKDVIRHLVTKKLDYVRIKNSDVKWVISGNVATMRSGASIEYVLDGAPGSLKLHVVQVWAKSGRGWQLLVRQGTKL